MQNTSQPPDAFMQGNPTEINAPTFTEPDRNVPPLGPYDLTGPGLDLYAPSAVDPLLPTLAEYPHPENLSIYPDPALAVAPFQADQLLYEHPDGLDMPHDLDEPDPLLPDLQHPDLTPQVAMQQRPGDLDSSAVQDMHLDATYQQLGQKMYPAVFMDQSGMNTARTRHMDLLMRGLDAQEQ